MTSTSPAGIPRPQTHVLAIWLMIASAIVSAISSLYQLTTIDEQVRSTIAQQGRSLNNPDLPDMASTIRGLAIGTLIVTLILSLAIWAVMIWFNRKGKNWARITATVLGGIQIISLIAALASPTAGGVQRAISVVVLLLDITILVLFWLRPTSQYYNAVTAEARARKAGQFGSSGGGAGYAQPYPPQGYQPPAPYGQQPGQFPTYPPSPQPGEPQPPQYGQPQPPYGQQPPPPYGQQQPPQ